jgi:hypothetical protein
MHLFICIAFFHYSILFISRKVLGGGPIADQVTYETLKRQAEAISNGSFNQEENDDEGLSIKFLRSSLAEAIRNTFVNGISFS